MRNEIRDQRSVGWGGGCALSAQWGGGAALAMEGGGGWRGAAAVRPARDKWVTAAPAGNRGGSHKHTRGAVGRGGWPWRGDGRQADERRVQVGRTPHATNITTIVHLNLQHQRNTGHSQLSRGVGEARGTARTIARTARSKPQVLTLSQVGGGSSNARRGQRCTIQPSRAGRGRDGCCHSTRDG